MGCGSPVSWSGLGSRNQLTETHVDYSSTARRVSGGLKLRFLRVDVGGAFLLLVLEREVRSASRDRGGGISISAGFLQTNHRVNSLRSHWVVYALIDICCLGEAGLDYFHTFTWGNSAWLFVQSLIYRMRLL